MKNDWEIFYDKFTEKILEYYDKDKRSELATIFDEVYKSCYKDVPTYGNPSNSNYFNKNYSPSKKDKSAFHYFTPGEVGVIDPFTIISCLNSTKDVKQRAKICAKFNEKLNNFVPNDQLPKKFKGVPTINSSQRTIVWCSLSDINKGVNYENIAKGDKDRIDMLWDFFKLALEIRENPNLLNVKKDEFNNYFNETNSIKGVKHGKTSIILFCIAPNVFLSSDSYTTKYLGSLNINGFPSGNLNVGSVYLDYVSSVKQYTLNSGKSFIDLSYEAYQPANTGYVKKDKQDEDDKSYTNKSKLSSEASLVSGTNKIYYGIPGSGKSQKIKDEITDRVGSKYYVRILFHPDYTYSDFVGQILPKRNGEEIDYEFVPGPFTSILKDALNDKAHMHYLIIEEINRGNAPAIFGDIFQLLDRDENSESTYSIINADISYEIYKSAKGETEEQKKAHEIRIPSNLTIIATMNTSDQNVFTLDTAFKRRWEMEYVEDAFKADDYSNELKGAKLPNSIITWEKFHDVINEVITSSPHQVVSTEDKRLGCYFATLNELSSIDSFTNKIIRYIWDDVSKTNRNIFKPDIKTFDDIYEKRNNEDFIRSIFNDDIANKLEN